MVSTYLLIKPEPLFTKREDVLPQDLAKIRSREIRVETFPIALKYDRHLGGTAARIQALVSLM